MFQPTASPPKNAVGLIFDLEGFSRFFNQPDVSDYLPRFLNHVFDAVEISLQGGDAYWMGKKYASLEFTVAQRKFMGDGALYVLLPEKGKAAFSIDELSVLCNRLWYLKGNFSRVLERCAEDVPVVDLPRRIRFGLARGSVIELREATDDSTEYVGFCINLASRLQKYCPHLGFIASARMGLKQTDLDKHGYIKTVATAIKGFPEEIVLVDKREMADFEKENKQLFASLFRHMNQKSG